MYINIYAHTRIHTCLHIHVYLHIYVYNLYTYVNRYTNMHHIMTRLGTKDYPDIITTASTLALPPFVLEPDLTVPGWDFGKYLEALGSSPASGRIQKVGPPGGSVIYSIGVFQLRIGGLYFLDPPGALGSEVISGLLFRGRPRLRAPSNGLGG